MIERVTDPPDLTDWNPTDGESMYLEFYGETRPVINTAYAEVLAAGGAVDGTPQTGSAPAPVYEYWWTIGHPGGVPTDHSKAEKIFHHGAGSFWQRLEEEAAQVVVSFPLEKGWRIKELTTTLKYLSPAKKQGDLWNDLGSAWKVLAPLLGTAGAIAGGLPGAAISKAAEATEVNAKPLHTSGDILDALGKLSLNSVPAGDTFKWSVAKMTERLDDSPTQSILWQIPREIFMSLGGRITGSVAVSFMPDSKQRPGQVGEGKPTVERGNASCRAVIHAKDGGMHYAPARDHADSESYLSLAIEPKLPAKASAQPTKPLAIEIVKQDAPSGGKQAHADPAARPESAG
jgi:hypothetical protein